jgi:hypothetical protein
LAGLVASLPRAFAFPWPSRLEDHDPLVSVARENLCLSYILKCFGIRCQIQAL